MQPQVEHLLNRYAAGLRDFERIDLSEANLVGAQLSGINFQQATLNVANFSHANLSQGNLSNAKLNAICGAGANLSQANLARSGLNGANLTRAILTGADLSQASMLRADLVRAEMSHSNLRDANLSEANLKEGQLQQANLNGANLSRADMRSCSLMAANLEQARLPGANLNRANLSGADLRDVELRHANLNCANLSGANLSGANLRWVDLNGADLRWADLSGAKLSGATLVGANLNHANLLNASLVHADLTQANLIQADWIGADLTGVTLTGAKLYGVSRFGLSIEGMSCAWIDLSPTGDRTQIHNFATIQDARKFFTQTPPTVSIVIDTTLNQVANLQLAQTYHQIASVCSFFSCPPSVEVGYRRTILTFKVENDDNLLPMAYISILPFKDAEAAQTNLTAIPQIERWQGFKQRPKPDHRRIMSLRMLLQQTRAQVDEIDTLALVEESVENLTFFAAATQIMLTNSSGQVLKIYQNPMFGKRFIKPLTHSSILPDSRLEAHHPLCPTPGMMVDFIQGFCNQED
ncbi:MAG: hypothetical protein F6K19_10410 [Cyanothece sp. SIO1E1]|nr:hypothetical protein [Cyanothece sp. SIO1E1]